MKSGMKHLKWTVFILVAAGLAFFLFYRQTHQNYYDYLTMSGATPLAVAKKAPSHIVLEIDGLVKKNYRFTGDALNALAFTRIRTREVSPDGKFMGAYSYIGVPVFHILEGVAPQKPKNFSFDQPLDMVVTFHSASGKTSRFSFNELIMVDDRFPVTLAFSREPLRPTSETAQATYTHNRLQADLKGLRLICPREPDTGRYLDQVERISYAVLPVDETRLPPRKKKFRCKSDSITCFDGKQSFTATTQGAAANPRWLRIGHGHGYDEIASVKGYDLRSFLRTNFKNPSTDDFFLFVACDGYRALFSGREIFLTDDGAEMLIVNQYNGQAPSEGYMLAPTKDFFADRAMWGLARVVRIGSDQTGM